jgi:hypothetical protein
MAELGSTDSNDDDTDNSIKTILVDENINDQIDDDELEQLAQINANLNSNNLTEKPLQPKGVNLGF